MIIYYIVMISMLLLAVTDKWIGSTNINQSSDNKIQKGTAFLMTLILALVAGLRYNVGTDYSNYYASITVIN